MTTPRTAVHPSGAGRRTTSTRTVKGRGPSGSAAARRRSRPRTRRRTARPGRSKARKNAQKWWPALLVVAAALLGVGWDRMDDMATPGGICTVAGSGVTVTAEQLGNAEVIARVARDRGLPDRAVVIALATAQQESRLRNLDYGDRDSLGLFQQRPSQGWGTEAQVQDPVYASGKFFDHLVHVPGWDTGRLTDVAQAVQRSGFPEAYQQWEPMATELTAALAVGPTAPAADCT